MKNASILFVNPGPFGRLVDVYEYCNVLSNTNQVTYYGFNEKETTLTDNRIAIMHEDGYFRGFINKFKYIYKIYKLDSRNKYDIIWVAYFKGVLALSLLNRTKVFLDIRTGSIHAKTDIENRYNNIMRFETSCFRNISIISASLRNKLKISSRATIISLGANVPECYHKEKYDGLRILYVGTFSGRDIPSTIRGFSSFLDSVKENGKHCYTIIGYGTKEDISEILEAINKSGHENSINYIGKVKYTHLYQYYHNHNIGLSYIPKTAYYDKQPPTKTIEYLMNNMFVIATSTHANTKYINTLNGMLIDDNAHSLCDALVKVKSKILTINYELIRDNSPINTWSTIVENQLIPHLEKY